MFALEVIEETSVTLSTIFSAHPVDKKNRTKKNKKHLTISDTLQLPLCHGAVKEHTILMCLLGITMVACVSASVKNGKKWITFTSWSYKIMKEKANRQHNISCGFYVECLLSNTPQ